MRLVIDLQSLQTGSSNAGIGRYTKSFVDALLTNHSNAGDQFILLFNNNPLSEDVEGFIQSLKNKGLEFGISFFPIPEKTNCLSLLHRSFRKGVERLREMFIASLGPDVLLVTSLFEFEAITSISAQIERSYLAAVILYDLIPLEDPDLYLKGSEAHDWYTDKIENLKRADIYLCISNHSLTRAVEMLGIEPDACVNISGASTLVENFHNHKIKMAALSSDIPDNFVFYIGGLDPRKNVEKLVSAFIEQADDIREKYALVLAGAMSGPSRDILNQLISHNPNRPVDVVFLGYVEDPVLVELYKKCTVFVFPSSNEGFGLPPLEAMCFGAPVIASNRASLPEVVSNEESLFDPDNAIEFRETLRRSLTDEAFRKRLIEHSEMHCEKFSWKHSSDLGMEFIGRKLINRGASLSKGHQLEEDRRKIFKVLGLYCNGEQELMKMSKLISAAIDELKRLFNNNAINIVPRGMRMTNAFRDSVPNYEGIAYPYVMSSMLCREQHFHLPLYTYWCNKLKETPRFHRKQWELIYICHSLFERGFIRNGLSAIGFGVGKEPLAAYFSSQGLKVTATDLDFDLAKDLGWVETNQHSDSLLSLNEDNICPHDMFLENARFRNVDMNNIPSDIGLYDVCWSSCAFEHLGSIRKGLDFVINSSRLLKPGGIAVHTTEFNLSSNHETLDDNPDFVIFRKRDIEQLIVELGREDFIVEPIDFTAGEDELEQYIDLPPYMDEPHLRLELAGKYVSTSLGIIIGRKET